MSIYKFQEEQLKNCSFEKMQEILRFLHRNLSEAEWIKVAADAMHRQDSRYPSDPQRFARECDGDIHRLLFSDPEVRNA